MALQNANKSMVTKEINKDLSKGVQMIIQNLKSSLVVWSIVDKEMSGAYHKRGLFRKKGLSQYGNGLNFL